MNNTTHSKVLLTITIIVMFCLNHIISQTSVNREWIDNTGNPDTLIWSKTVVLPDNHLLHIGHTKIGGQNTHALITLYDIDGATVWQEQFSDSVQYDYYGVDADFDADTNLYVVGTAKNNTNNKAKVFLLKFNFTGTLLWEKFYHSGGYNEDIATGTIADQNGETYITAASKTFTTDFDYLILKHHTSGSLEWHHRYDNVNLIDFPIGVSLESNRVLVTGASASSISRWDYTTLYLDTEYGQTQGIRREGVASTGFDLPSAFTKDENGFFYITGRSSTDGIDYDIKTTKLDSNLNIVWSETYDFAGLKDEGVTIAVDSTGNVFVGGYVTRTGNVTDLMLLKYDTSGNQVWEHRQPGDDPTKDAKATAVQVYTDGELYFTGYEHKKNGNQRAIIGKYSQNNNTIYQRRTKSFPGLNELPTSLRISDDKSIYLTSIQDDNTSLEYATRRYTEFEQDKTPYLANDSIPVFRAQEIIVRFKQNALDSLAFHPVFQGKRREFDLLQTYLSSSSMHQIDDKLKKYYKEWDKRTPNPLGMKALKVFKELTPNLTTTINRLGDTIRVPDFWTTLLISFPEDLEFENVYTALNDLEGIIAYAEPNYFIEPTSLPNDEFFNLEQLSIWDDSWLSNPDDFSDTTRNSSIKIKNAWEIYPDAGRSDIKCGIVDYFVDYKHPDFGYNDGQADWLYNSSVVKDGYNFEGNSPYFGTSLDDENTAHGTEVAGIIGAVRNNSTGIAGIAGGNAVDDLLPNHPDYFKQKGVSLYSLNIYPDESSELNDPIIAGYNALVMSSIDDTLNNTFGVHLLNNSWGMSAMSGFGNTPITDSSYNLLREATHFLNKMNVSTIASRGNGGNASLYYPACMDDDWIMNVGGTGNSGTYASDLPVADNRPLYKGGIDFAAPAHPNLIFTLKNTYITPPQTYGTFEQTSASAPHVSGVVALMMSYYNDSTPTYKNLAPEDCEHILELTAENYEDMGMYSDFIGWGKINAGAALEMIDTLWSSVNHFGTLHNTNELSLTQMNTNAPLYLKENTRDYEGNWYTKGDYFANIYKATSTVHHSISAQDTIIGYWARPSSSEVLEPTVNDSLLPRERPQIEFIDRDSCIISGYIYEILDGSNNTIGWIPQHIDSIYPRMEYTIVTRDSLAPVANLAENNSNIVSNVLLYPNPSKNFNTLVFNNTPSEFTVIDLYDIQGRLTKPVYQGVINDGFNISVDISALSSGMYLYNISNETMQKTIKFIKE